MGVGEEREGIRVVGRVRRVVRVLGGEVGGFMSPIRGILLSMGELLGKMHFWMFGLGLC